MSETLVFRTPGASGYGRHAAPPAAYGPADVHRVLPAPPVRPAAVEQAGSAEARTEVVQLVARPEIAGSEDSDDESVKTTGFWARLRLKAA